MFPRRIIAALVLSITASVPTHAQELSPEADEAFWCAAAFAALANQQGFISAAMQEAAMADLARFEPVMAAEAARLGWVQDDVVSLAKSYGEEVDPQIADFLRWRDPAALRLSLDGCFPNVLI